MEAYMDVFMASSEADVSKLKFFQYMEMK